MVTLRIALGRAFHRLDEDHIASWADTQPDPGVIVRPPAVLALKPAVGTLGQRRASYDLRWPRLGGTATPQRCVRRAYGASQSSPLHLRWRFTARPTNGRSS
jgi:hypothetical protein